MSKTHDLMLRCAVIATETYPPCTTEMAPGILPRLTLPRSETLHPNTLTHNDAIMAPSGRMRMVWFSDGAQVWFYKSWNTPRPSFDNWRIRCLYHPDHRLEQRYLNAGLETFASCVSQLMLPGRREYFPPSCCNYIDLWYGPIRGVCPLYSLCNNAKLIFITDGLATL